MPSRGESESGVVATWPARSRRTNAGGLWYIISKNQKILLLPPSPKTIVGITIASRRGVTFDLRGGAETPSEKMKKKKLAKRQVTPRKFPVQQRSRANVERILEAASVLLDQQGYDHLTTASIAGQAGCSIGSIYQYFPNKHAIMTSLVERWLTADNEVLEQVEMNQGQYESVVEEFLALTEKLVQVYKEQKGVFALVTLIRNIPELHRMAEVHDRQYAIRLMKIMNRYLAKGDNHERLARAGYFTIIVDAAAMSIATETPKRARLKHRFLRQSVRDLFEGPL